MRNDNRFNARYRRRRKSKFHLPFAPESFRSPKAGRKLNCNSFRFGSHHDSDPRWKAENPFLRLIRLFRERRPFGIISTFYDCLSLTFWKVKENEIARKNKEFLTTTRARLAIFFIAAAQFAFNPLGTIYGNLKLMLCRINKILFIAPIGLIGPLNGGGRKKTFSSSETEFISLCVQMCVK